MYIWSLLMLSDVVIVVVFNNTIRAALSTGLSTALTFPVSTNNTLLNEAMVVPGVDFRWICSTVSVHREDAGQLNTENLCYSAKPNDC